MERNAVKRKSESALPTGKTKQRKTTNSNGRDASASDEVGSQPGNEFFLQEQSVAAKHVKKGSLKSLKSEPTRAYRDIEYEDDPGRTESQEFLSLVEFETKRKKAAAKEAGYYLEKLTKNISRDEQELKEKLERLISTAATRDEDFLGAFRKAYKVATPCPPPADANQMESTSELRGFAVMYERSKHLTKVASELVARFERLGQQVDGQDTTGLMENEWGKEDKRFAHLVLVGKEVGITRCQSILNAPKEALVVFEEIEKGEALYGEEQPSLQWGRVARKEEKAVRKLINAVTSVDV